MPEGAKIIEKHVRYIKYRIPFFDSLVTIKEQADGRHSKKYEDGTIVWFTPWGEITTHFPDGSMHIEDSDGKPLFIPGEQPPGSIPEALIA